MNRILHNPDSWSLDGDTIKDTRENDYLPLFRVAPLTDHEQVSLALAAPALFDALKALVAQHDRPHGFDDERWYSREVAAAKAAIAKVVSR